MCTLYIFELKEKELQRKFSDTILGRSDDDL